MTLPTQFKPKTEIQEMMESLGCTGDRVKPQDIVDRIEDIDFQTVNIAGNKFMYCGIRMIGGFVVVGKPATCIDPSNWRDEIGQQVSFNNTFEEIYKLEAYRKMSTPKPVEPDTPPALGFDRYLGKQITRDAYQLNDIDLALLSCDSETNRATLDIEGVTIEFAYHCEPSELKAGDYVVFLNEQDTYHCSQEVFEERNEVNR